MCLALSEATPSPHIDYPHLRIVRLRGAAYWVGIETLSDNGATLRIYSPAKTIADCFKFRNKVGLDVALEALKDAWRQRKISMAEVSHHAEIDRVAKVMRPYLEAVVA